MITLIFLFLFFLEYSIQVLSKFYDSEEQSKSMIFLWRNYKIVYDLMIMHIILFSR